MKETRKQFEERLITEMLKELKTEPLCNILLYASMYLNKNARNEHERKMALILEKYSNKMGTRIEEARE